MQISGAEMDEVLSFERYQLDTRRRVLLENGQRVKLGSRALSILIVLAQRAGQIVSKRELLSRVWPNTFVVDGALRVQMSELQRALGKSEWGGQFVENIYGQGYRLAEPVVYRRRGPAAEFPGADEFVHPPAPWKRLPRRAP